VRVDAHCGARIYQPGAGLHPIESECGFPALLFGAQASEMLQVVEFFSDTGLRVALGNGLGLRFPLETRSDSRLPLDFAATSTAIPLADIHGQLLKRGMEKRLVLDDAIAASEAHRAAFWRLREERPKGQRLEGAQLKDDMSVPPERIAAFVMQGSALCHARLPGGRVKPDGHLCDGNIHINPSSPTGKVGFGSTRQNWLLPALPLTRAAFLL
jgi:FAD/FMN-containing dehydrogenase